MTGHLAYCLSRKRGELSLWKLEQGVLSNTWICHPSIYFCFEALLDNIFFHLKPRNTCGHWTTWNQLWANWNDDVGLVSQFLRHAPGKNFLHCETIQPCMSFSMGNHHINGTNYFPNTYEKRKSRLGNWIPAHREHPSILQKKCTPISVSYRGDHESTSAWGCFRSNIPMWGVSLSRSKAFGMAHWRAL
jgi:hypothetical protein